MTDDQKIEQLTAALRQPEGKYPHAAIRARLAELKASYDVPSAPSSPAPSSAAAPAAAPPEDDDPLLPRLKRGFKRMDEIAAGPAVALNQFVNTMSGGVYRKATDTLAKKTGIQVGPSEEQYQQVERENPFAMNTASGLAYMMPSGVPAFVGKQVNRGIDPLTRIIAKKAPNLAASLPGRAAGTLAKGGAVGAGTAAGTTAVEGAVRGDDPRDIIDNAQNNAKFAAVFGAGANALFGAGGAFARSRQAANPNIGELARYNLEPGPILGRPVIRTDEAIARQLPGLSKQPLGINRVTPATRGAASRQAGDPILDDITKHSRANNQRFGELQGEAYAAQGERVAPFKHILKDIDARLADQALSDPTKAALTRVREKFGPYLPKPPVPAPKATNPDIEQMEKQLLDVNLSPKQKANLERTIENFRAQLPQPPPPPPPEPPPPFTAKTLDKIRDFADDFVRRGEIQKRDVQFIQAADVMRNTVRKVAPGIADLNAAYAETRKGIGKRQAMAGAKKTQRGEGEDVYETVGRRIRETGEETGNAGVRVNADKGGANIERLAELGQPPVLPGTKKPADFSYRQRLDVPRLQLAQESLQLTPSKLWSGSARQLMTAIPDRLLYPVARRLGEKQVGSNVQGFDELTRVVRQRGERNKRKKRTAGAEQ